MATLFLIKAKITSKAIIKRYADNGSLWRAPLVNVKYWVAKPPFTTHNCWSFNNILIQLKKLSPKLNFFKAHNKKSWSKESKAFSRSIVTQNLVIFSLPQISMMPDINLPFSLMQRFSTYAVWFEEIKDGKMSLHFAAKALEIIFVSILSKMK